MRNIHDTGAGRIVPSHHIVPLIVVDCGIPIHKLCEDVPTDMWEVRTEQPPNIGFKPVEARQELVDSKPLIPFDDAILHKQAQQMRRLVIHIGHRPKSEIFVD